jgi:hypothetical protein
MTPHPSELEDWQWEQTVGNGSTLLFFSSFSFFFFLIAVLGVQCEI